MASLGSLIVKLAADTSEFKKGFDDARKTAGGFESVIGDLSGKVGKFMTVVGAGAAVGAFTKQLFDATVEAGKQAEQMEQLASRTGIAAQSMEGMSVSLNRVGLSHQGLAMGMQLLSRNMIEARNGSADATAAFERMGVQLANAGTNEEVLRKIADQFATMPDGAEKTALAMKLFGRAGAELIPILNQGSAGLDAARKKAEEFGLVLTDTQRGALSKFDDKMDDLASATKGFGTQIGVTMANAFSTMADKATGAVSMVTQLIKAMRDGGPEFDKFAEKFMGALPGGSAASLAAGVGRPAQGTEKTLSAGPIPDDLSIPKKFISLEEHQVDLGNQRVRQAQQAVFYAEKLGVPYREAEKATRGLSEMQFQNLLSVKLQEQKFMPALVAMQNDLAKGAELEFKNRNDMFGAQVAQEEHLQQLAEGRDKAFKPGKFMQMDFNDNAPLAGGVQDGGQIANIAEGWRVANDAIDGFNNSQALMTEDLTKTSQYAKADAAIAAAKYRTETGFFRDSSDARATAIHQIETQRDLEIQLEKVRNGGHITFAKLTEIESTAQAQILQTAQQFPTVWDSALKAIDQASTFIWGNIVSQFSSSVATMMVKGGDFKQFMENAQIMILQTFISSGIQMTAAWLVEQAKQVAAAMTSDAAKVASATAANTSIAASSTASATVMMGAFVSAAAAVKGAIISMSGTFMTALTALWGMARAVIGSIAAAMKTTVFGIPVGLAITAALIAGSVAVMHASKAAGIAMAGLAAGTAALTLIPFASGGIVTGPTPALVGEAGPEAIIPLSQLGNMGGTSEVHVHLNMNGRELAYEVAPELIGALRLRYGVAI